ncbi:alpha-L-rhamnosidase C-terminal domain-containing protein [Plantactinospora sp. ZYX-F-223]|uniref:alpha-L-rhamnosidase-related protein n=1 Tax=Plantactinospora sp. ZYX-F-223 TaxID=3144103 RepID=UPI0031FD88DD
MALLCPVLADHGRADLAYALLHQDEYPSWGYSIRHGATTIWERWDGWTDHAGFQSPAMNSFNHYSLGSVGDWLFGRVAGIDQTAPSVAYRELLLRPLPGGRLRWARAEQETVRGRVACGWSVEEGRIAVTATVPPGSVLDVCWSGVSHSGSDRSPGSATGPCRRVARFAAGGAGPAVPPRAPLMEAPGLDQP